MKRYYSKEACSSSGGFIKLAHLLITILILSTSASAEETADEPIGWNRSADEEIAPPKKGGVYSAEIQSFDKKGEAWYQIYRSQNEVLLSCRAEQTGGSAHRKALLERYRIHLSMPAKSKISLGRRSDSSLFRHFAKRAGTLASMQFNTQDADACSGTFRTLVQQLKVRVEKLNAIQKKINLISSRFESRNKKIGPNLAPFGPAITRELRACDMPFSKAMNSLVEAQSAIQLELNAFKAQLKEDTEKVEAYRVQLQENLASCGEAGAATTTTNEETETNTAL